MTIVEKEEELFNEWGKNRSDFVPDGAVSERHYLKSCPKICFILKEVNDPGEGFDLREFMRNGGRDATWNNVARWVHGIRNLPSECNWSFYKKIDEGFRMEVLRDIVAMNLKKSPGGSSTDSADLKKVVGEDTPFIQKQYAIYDPDITICGGAETTAGLFREAVHPNMSWKQTTRGIWWYRRNADKYVVALPHPEARVQDSLLLYASLDAIKEIRDNQDQGCLGD